MRTIEEQATHLLQKMTVDMSIDLWQTKECAMAACDVMCDYITAVVPDADNNAMVIYWQAVKQRVWETR